MFGRAILSIDAKSARTWTPHFPDRIFETRYGDWQYQQPTEKQRRNVSVFAAPGRSLIWFWDLCCGVCTDVMVLAGTVEPLPAEILGEVSGAVFVSVPHPVYHPAPVRGRGGRGRGGRGRGGRGPDTGTPDRIRVVHYRVYVIPLLNDAMLLTEEERAARTPPARLPSVDAAPLVRARLVAEVEAPPSLLLPEGSDAHPPIIKCDYPRKLYRLEQ